MPRIFDNIAQQLLPALRETIELSTRSDFCVGYFNLRGWKELGSYIEPWPGGEGHCCRLLIGMAKVAEDEGLRALRLCRGDGGSGEEEKGEIEGHKVENNGIDRVGSKQ